MKDNLWAPLCLSIVYTLNLTWNPFLKEDRVKVSISEKIT